MSLEEEVHVYTPTKRKKKNFDTKHLAVDIEWLELQALLMSESSLFTRTYLSRNLES